MQYRILYNDLAVRTQHGLSNFPLNSFTLSLKARWIVLSLSLPPNNSKFLAGVAGVTKLQGMERKLYLTGASGLLGRAIKTKFNEEGWNVYGTAFSRTTPELHKIDLNDQDAVEKSVINFKPNYIIHCAAQRFPDKVQADPLGAEKLNVTATKTLANIADQMSAPMLYISTDYVFDGTSPPYKVNDIPSPVNLYGELKLRGEETTLASSPRNAVLRIPVLYGPVEKLSESAVTVLLDNLLNVSQSRQISNYEKRCPSHVNDIAQICFQMVSKTLQGSNIQGIYHWCGKEKLTKYDMILIMADTFGLPYDHITPAADPPKSTGTITRPYDTTLDTARIDALQIGQHTPFKNGILSSLKSWVP